MSDTSLIAELQTQSAPAVEVPVREKKTKERKQNTWVRACKIYQSEHNNGQYIVPAQGTDAYKMIKEIQAKLVEEEKN